MTNSTVSITQRYFFLDWLRILAFASLVLYHVGMYYVTWDWHIKSPSAGRGLEPWMNLLSPWRMDLLFLIFGVATSVMLSRNGASASLLKERSARLLWPLLFGILVIVPPQAYLEVVHHLAYAGSYAEFMRAYLQADHGFCRSPDNCLILPTWNHLWYLPYLLIYTLVLWALLRVWPKLLDRLGAPVTRALGGIGLLAVPVVVLALTHRALSRPFPINHSVVGDWYAHAQYFGVFLLGAVLARSSVPFSRMQSQRWVALALAVSAWLGMALFDNADVLNLDWLTAVHDALLVWLWSPELGAALFALQQWGALVAAIGFGQRYLNVDNRARAYLTEAVFPVYILHQTVIIVLAHQLLPWAFSPVAEASLLVVATLAICFLGFEIVRRLPWLRPMFGLKRENTRAN